MQIESWVGSTDAVLDDNTNGALLISIKKKSIIDYNTITLAFHKQTWGS